MKLNGTLASNGDVQSFEISQDSSRVVYLADQETDGIFELYLVDINGGTADKLNGELPYLSWVASYRLSTNNKYVVYRADQDVYDEWELFGVRVGGSKLCFPVKGRGGVSLICL